MEEGTENYFRQICDNLAFTLIAVDRDSRVRFWNQQAGRQFHSSSEEMKGRSFLDIFPEAHRQQVRDLLQAAFEKQSSGDLEVKFEAEDGKRSTFVLIISPIADSNGNCIGASASMRDISERKRLSQELSRSRRLASLGNVAGGVAHHFNNILGGMLTSIDYVLPSDSPREFRRTLRLLAQAIGRATRITQRLAAFAEAETEELEWADLNGLLGTFIERVRPQTQQRHIELVTDIKPMPPRQFEVQRVLPVLDSLVQNAFDAMGGGGRLTIGMQQEDEQAVITVMDTGCGIPEDLLDRLFEPFFTTKGALGGGDSDNVGLGLAAVHGLVSEMGGTIQVSSKVSEGTRVEVRLPLNRPLTGSAEGPQLPRH
ncbi:MAG TPA: ATP-binding protein [Phycisphaerae bacterium]|nr:ATP-binding protein [Phycisphaerae bacterium]